MLTKPRHINKNNVPLLTAHSYTTFRSLRIVKIRNIDRFLWLKNVDSDVKNKVINDIKLIHVY